MSEAFDGFIYDRNFIYSKGILKRTDSLLRSLDKPIIILDGDENKYFDNMPSHDYDEFRRIAEHLINTHGYKRIYCLTGTKGLPQAEERLQAYLDTMKKYDTKFACDRQGQSCNRNGYKLDCSQL